MKFTEKYTVNCHDTDLFGHIKPTGLMRYMQDTVQHQMEKLGPSYDELMSRHRSFILSRIKINIHAPVLSHDVIESSTWATTKSHGVSFSRCYEVEKDGVSVAEGSSIWALLDTDSGRFIRTSDFGEPYGADEPLDIELPRKLTPIGEVEKVGEKTVFYSDVDQNVHMNNTVYADMLWNFVPDFKSKRMTSIDILYVSEAPLGETIEIYRGKTENGYFFRTLRSSDGKVNVEAVIETEKLV